MRTETRTPNTHWLDRYVGGTAITPGCGTQYIVHLANWRASREPCIAAASEHLFPLPQRPIPINRRRDKCRRKLRIAS